VTLVLKRASATRPSGEWNDDDFDVLADGRVRRPALGGAAAWPLAAHGQQSTMPVIGFLQTGAQGGTAHMTAAFHRGIKEVGYVEGQNVEVVYRYADGQYDQLPSLVADLVRRQVALIGAFGPPAAQAAKAAGRRTWKRRSAGCLRRPAWL